MEEQLKELKKLWDRYLNTNAIEDLYKAYKLNNEITFELCGETTFPNICNEIITEAIKRECDILKREAYLILKASNVLRSFQMLDCFVTIDLPLNKRAKLIISIYDILKVHESKINSLSYRINQNYSYIYINDDLEKITRLNDVCEEYHSKYEFIRDMFENTQNIEDKEKQSPTLPKELDTPEGKDVLERGVNGGILDNNYQLLDGVTNGEAAVFAICAKEMLGLKDHWKCFESLWNKKNMKSIKLVSTSEEKIKKVKKMFPRDIAYNALKDKY